MTIMQNNQSSKAARDAYRKVRNQRNLARAAKLADDLPVATFGNIVDSADNLLNGPIIKNASSAALTIPIWADTGDIPGDEQILTLHVAPGRVTDPDDASFVEVQKKVLTYPFAPAWDPNFTLPLNRIQPNGTYTFKHEVFLHNQQLAQSPLVQFTTDITAPYELTNPPEPKAMNFNIKELDDSNLANVSGVIPDYTDRAPKDKFVYWFVKDPLPDDPSTLDPVTAPEDVPASGLVRVPAAYLQALEDGIYYLLYVLIDRATNRSNLSAFTRFTVTLGALPTALQKPVVPAAAGGAVIDLATAASRVIVEFKYTGGKPGDKIVAQWGGIDLPVEFAQNGYAEIVVPPQTLLAAYKAAGGVGETTITVKYSVDRLGRLFGPEQDDVKVNFTLIGTPLDPWPDFPDPTNPNLKPGVVKGSTADNVLVVADADKDVPFEFEVYDPVNANEKMKFIWMGTHVVEADHTITTEQAGDKVTRNIPWSYIAATDNGPDKEVYYSIGDPSVTPNWQDSPKTLVNVNDAIVLTPDEPTFPHIAGRWLNCSSLQGADNHIVVDVPDLSKWLSPGEKVSMSWELFPGRGTPGTPIVDTLLEEDITLTDGAGAFPATGFKWKVQPYADYIAPSYNPPTHSDATAVVTYSFDLKGKTVTSKPAMPWLGMFVGNGGCPIP
ncbi:hypothetical protein [Pseudomonas izuensis]|uniref:hypothetical protein n=1 Tax=Pseudomonas izuensis TaxID=2684212 RepID=UPI00135A0466|nr:hypothetical protein [Pseudomonas izuensis]